MTQTSRTAWLKSQGFTVTRFWNDDVLKSLDGIYNTITDSVPAAPSPLPRADARRPLPQGGEDDATLSPRGRGVASVAGAAGRRAPTRFPDTHNACPLACMRSDAVGEIVRGARADQQPHDLRVPSPRMIASSSGLAVHVID